MANALRDLVFGRRERFVNLLLNFFLRMVEEMRLGGDFVSNRLVY